MLYLRTTIGSVPHITPQLLDQIDPECRIGLYITYDAFCYEISEPLHTFLNEKRKIIIGPTCIDYPPQLSTDGKVRVRTTGIFLTLNKQEFADKIDKLRPDFAIVPSPHPRKENYTRADFNNFEQFDGIEWIYEAGDYAGKSVFSADISLLRASSAEHKYFYCESNIQNMREAQAFGCSVITNAFEYFTSNTIMLDAGLARYQMKNRRFEADVSELDESCELECCQTSRAYIHHLVACHELTGYILIEMHNVSVLKRLWEQSCEELGSISE